MNKEADVKARIKRELTARNWLYWMTPANGYGKSGLPDFFALKSGKIIGIEAKFGRNSPTTSQRLWMDNLEAQGCECVVVSDKNLDVFVDWLDALCE